MNLLTIVGLSVAYGDVAAVQDVSLRVDAGEIVALVGESGSGKSSIALAAVGLLPDGAAMRGSIGIEGGAAIIFQDPLTALNPALTIGRQIGEAFRGARAERRAAVVAAMREAGLDLSPDLHPHMLSGGQRQRVAIAMALIGRPRLLIADEPTAALDPLVRRQIADLLVARTRAAGAGLLLVTHDLALAARLADRIVVLEGGRIVESGGVERLRAPQSASLLALVAAQPRAGEARGVEGEAILAMRGVSRRFRGGWRKPPVVALEGVSIVVRPGETVGVIGGSGAGKTTLARLALGLDRPDGGAVTIGGVSPTEARGSQLRALRRRVQAVFQDPASSLDPRFTVARAVAEPLHLLDARPDRAGVAAMVGEALASVELDPALAERWPHQLSGGQRQRVALARALILAPELVVLDEALSALDARVRAELLALLRRLQRERGLAYLMIGHDLSVIRAMADRVVVLRDGRVVAEGPAGMLDAPGDPYVAALVAASPSLDQALAERAL